MQSLTEKEILTLKELNNTTPAFSATQVAEIIKSMVALFNTNKVLSKNEFENLIKQAFEKKINDKEITGYTGMLSLFEIQALTIQGRTVCLKYLLQCWQ